MKSTDFRSLPASPGGIAAIAAACVVFLSSIEAGAQCSVGTAIHKGCLGVGYEGCCEIKESLVGYVTVVQWCESGFLCQLICNPFVYETALCGWDAAQGIYNCTSDTIEDPTGQHPWACDIPCGDVPAAGCCEGQTLLKSCKNGKLGIVNCAANGEGLRFCGWDPVHQYYGCGPSPAVGPVSNPYTCGETTCTPDCAGRECGTDGCDGTCGACTAGQQCSADGKCVPEGCQPDCHFKDCGPDGCGESCGTCGGGYVCNTAQKCVTKPCEPDCTNKECGPDLCGGVCGVCAPPYACSAWFECVGPDEEVALLPDVAEDTAIAPDPGGVAGDGSRINLDSKNPNLCPDGFVSSYGKCVAGPQSDEGGSGDGCAAGRAGGSAGEGAAALWVLFLLALYGKRRRSRFARGG